MSIQPIKTKSQYLQALAYLEKHFSAIPGTTIGNIVEVLTILIEKYEDQHFPIDSPTPVEAIKFRMEQLGMTNVEFARIIGTRARVSELLNGKRQLSIRMIRNVHRELKVPAEVLLQA